MEILLPKYSVIEKKKGVHIAEEFGGRQTNPKKGYQSAASFVGDLADSRQCIVLCNFCKTKWNHGKNKYKKRWIPDPSGVTDGFNANGKCDACKQHTSNMGGGHLYVSEETWKQVSMDPAEARKKARAAWKKKSGRDELRKAIADAKHNPYKYRPKSVTIPMTDKRRFK
jgi:hypothetical protein